ncbi:uncharacterized protein LY89DRAFT_123704 [Mollisia scopiformis]|uniref:SET domain-containing protein n=1 Tax=Mollisia scopiformis TaxID=149040 RepID=A0A194X3T1_MOLSC|nr:uncharacterized protein LY89DRAFT_123704 [Mollisia scopiformis]KUJ14843.1 hypothetical protein LY89DRAFT_123704 [Mollisia scopiformis]
MSPIATSTIDSYDLSPDQYKVIYEDAIPLEGQPPSALGKDDLVRIHNRNLELKKESGKSRNSFVLPAAYAPSSASLDTLQKISLSDLKLGTHNRGYFVTARTITSSYHSTDLITILEDDSGAVARLVQGFQNFSSSDSSIPLNSTVAIKEPYCKFNGENDWIIRVDHPSDIAVLKGDDAAVSLILQFVTEKKEISPTQWREAGDLAYLDKKFSSAIECYTQAIDNSTSDTAFKLSTLRKRAFANLTARSFSAAKEDAIASCLDPPEPGDEKAYFCAGRAAYELGLYTESEQYFTTALNLKPRDPKTLKELRKTQTRISEQETGVYNFASMIDRLKKGEVHLDHADFVSNTEVKMAEGKGRGLFARREIKKGEVVMVEKAFCLPDLYTTDQSEDIRDGQRLEMWNFNTNSRTQRPAQASLFLQLLKKIYGDAEASKKFFELDGGSYLRSGKEAEIVDGVPVIDSFLTEAIRLRNCFSCPSTSLSLLTSNPTIYNSHTTPLSAGLWTHAAYINHSCIPNSIRSFIGDIMIIRATCTIPAGAEILHQYKASDAAYLVRKQVFEQNWGFVCECPLCGKESGSKEVKHGERSELVERIKREVGRLGKEVSVARIRGVEKLVRRLEGLHESEVYAGLPRLMLIHPCIWLLERWREKREWGMVVKYGLDVLRNFGFGEDVVREGTLELGYEKGIMNVESMRALKVMGEAYKELGKLEVADECEKEAKGMFVVLTGSEVGIEDFFST